MFDYATALGSKQREGNDYADFERRDLKLKH
jgi:hypothetical protein